MPLEVDSPEIIGRIVSASPRVFTVECFQRDAAPPLGAAVVVVEGGPAAFAIVRSIATEGVDPSRPLAPHGSAEEDLETVLSRHPHLPVLLRTTFEAAVAAHELAGSLRYYLPDAPPRLISRVRPCSAAELFRLARRLDFLAALLQAGELSDDVAAAFLRQASRTAADPRGFLVNAGRALVPYLINDPERLAALMRRIQS